MRSAQANDAVVLAELGARTFRETFAADNTPDNMAAYLASAFSPAQQAADLADPQCWFQIGEVDAIARGYAMLRNGNVPPGITGARPIELVRLYVSRDSLGSGMGAALMRASIAQARQLDFETLWLGVWEHNTRAQAFYRKWNFQEVGTHVFQLGNDPQTDLLMQLSLADEPNAKHS